jgi:protein-S-isoprenylcysteine O-methyltransferase Ste14
MKAAPARQRGSGWVAAALKTVAFTVLVPGTLAVYLPYRMLSRRGIPFPGLGVLQLSGALLVVLGAVGYLLCAKDFALRGRGTPAPIDPPKVLIARGLYRFLRNPMYGSVLLVLCGESLFFESRRLLGYALGVAVMFHLLVLLYEEPTLKEKFDEAYVEYCKTVPRWIPLWRSTAGKN